MFQRCATSTPDALMRASSFVAASLLRAAAHLTLFFLLLPVVVAALLLKRILSHPRHRLQHWEEVLRRPLGPSRGPVARRSLRPASPAPQQGRPLAARGLAPRAHVHSQQHSIRHQGVQQLLLRAQDGTFKAGTARQAAPRRN